MDKLKKINQIGQLFVIGVSGSEVDSNTRDVIADIQPAGFCLFSRNLKSAEQTNDLLENLTKISPEKTIFSIDQEGGLVDRLRRVAVPMLSVSDLSSFADAEDIREFAAITGETLRVLGFNLNFAPVVDVADESRQKFLNGLNSRVFGQSKDDVTRFAEIYIDALQKTECLATLKHFPGLGAAEIDSHEELPLVNSDSQEFDSVDLFPYRQLIKNKNVFSLMVGHTAYPQLDWQERDFSGNYLPASLSYNVIEQLLRRDLDFKGVVFSDDMEMGAIQKNYGIGKACVMAIQAGIDILLICNSEAAVYEGFEAVSKAVGDGDISQTRLNESLQRIARLKKLLPEPIKFDKERIAKLSERIAALNAKVKNLK